MQTDGLAIRGFTDLVCDAESTLAKHPEDYTLFRLDTWDDQTGKADGWEAPVCLGTGLEFVAARAINTDKIAALHGEIESLKNGEDEHA